MDYIQYTFTVSPTQPGSEILIAMLADLGFESFENTETGFKAYIQEDLNKMVELSDLVFEAFKYDFKQEKIIKRNWNKEWESNFEPVIINETCCIKAPFHQLDKKYPYEIVIMPKMSFGTGHHDTTWLVCKNILENDFKNKTVMDMGCGTGVLAILAKLKGASGVTGIDIDDWSIENAIENCENNNCPDINIVKSDPKLFDLTSHYDVIFANINKNVLKQYLPVYAKLLKNSGQLYLSGFFKTDCEELIHLASENSFILEKQEIKNDWAVLIFKKA